MLNEFVLMITMFTGGSWTVSQPSEFLSKSFYREKVTPRRAVTLDYNLQKFFLDAIAPVSRNEVSTPTVTAQSLLVLDERTGFPLAQKKAYEQRPMASITKLMTALVVADEVESETIVEISPQTLRVTGDPRGLVAGEKISVKELNELMLVDSNNQAATVLADFAGGTEEGFVAKMNARAASLGLKQTHFVNATGLDDAALGTNVSSTWDLALLADFVLQKHPEIFEVTLKPSLVVVSADGNRRHSVVNTNELLGKMPGIVGGKTGYTFKAGECLMLITENPERTGKIITVVLGSKDRFGETRKITDWAFGAYGW